MKYLILFLIASCNDLSYHDDRQVIYYSGQQDPRISLDTDSEFRQYVDRFETQYQIDVSEIPINFSDPIRPNSVGSCLTYYLDDEQQVNEIIIRKSWWQQADHITREILIFHELGHCALDRRHDTETIMQDGVEIAKSVMYPYVISAAYYSKYRDYYLNELEGD